MKIAIFLMGILIILLLALGVYSGDILNGITAILWLPITLFWDVPMMILPLTIGSMAVLSLYGVVTKNYQRFYDWYRNLFIVIVYGILAYEIENLFRTTSFFKLPEYITFFVCFFLILASIGFTAYVETKKDSRYYIVISGLVIVYLAVKFICFAR